MTKKLSICMIVKDEEKNLRRCLESLAPLLQQDYTEIIIVDTGSTDNTIEIAKDYTNKVYFHEWNGNFSDMRNISISYATGEWIFIIDADEELETAKELILLLDDPKLKEYNTIRIREKNLLSLTLNKYVYHVQERLFRNDGTFHYRGTIHNQAVYKHPISIQDIWLMHYGYDNEDKDLMEKKYKRTAGMLKKELEKDPDNIYYRFQLARSYMMHQDTILALDEITKAYNTMKRQPVELIVKRYYVFGEYARMYLNAKKYEQVIEVCNEGLTYNKNYLDLYYYMGHAYLSLMQYEKGIESLEKYLNFYVKYHNNELDLSNFTAIEMYSLDETAFHEVLDRLITLFYKNRSLTLDIGKYYSWINQLKKKEMTDKYATQLFLIEKNYEGLVNLYKTIKNTQLLDFSNYIEILKKDLNDEEKEKLECNFSSIDDQYGLLNIIRVSNNKGKLLVEFINKYNIIEYIDEVIIEFCIYLLEYNYLNRLFKKLNGLTIKKIVSKLIDKEHLREYFLNSLRTDYKFSDYQNNRVFIGIANVVLLLEVEESKKENKDISNLIDIFNKYLEKGIENIRFIYNIEKIRLLYNTHENIEEKFLMIMYLYQSQHDEGNNGLAMKYLREAGEVYPYFATFLSLYAKEIKAELQMKEALTSFNDVKNREKDLKILHGTIEIANQMNTLVNAQNNIQNVSALGVNYYSSYLKYDDSYILNLNQLENNHLLEVFEHAVNSFDVFHFHFNTSLLPNLTDLPLLKNIKKKVFMNHWGTDVRRLSIAKKISPYAKSKNENEEQIINQLNYLGKYIDDCIVADAELYEYVKDYYNRVHIVRQALDLSQYTSNPEFKFRKNKPILVHAPTSTDFKGTKFINAAIEKLMLKYDFEYKLVQNMSHEQAKQVYQNADIIIDQLHSAGHGLLSLEAMAMEKPVICSISEFMSDFYPKEIPIFSANPENIEIKIEQLITDFELRDYLGKQGRSYVEKYHDQKQIASDLIKIYNS